MFTRASTQLWNRPRMREQFRRMPELAIVRSRIQVQMSDPQSTRWSTWKNGPRLLRMLCLTIWSGRKYSWQNRCIERPPCIEQSHMSSHPIKACREHSQHNPRKLRLQTASNEGVPKSGQRRSIIVVQRECEIVRVLQNDLVHEKNWSRMHMDSSAN